MCLANMQVISVIAAMHSIHPANQILPTAGCRLTHSSSGNYLAARYLPTRKGILSTDVRLLLAAVYIRLTAALSESRCRRMRAFFCIFLLSFPFSGFLHTVHGSFFSFLFQAVQRKIVMQHCSAFNTHTLLISQTAERRPVKSK